MKKKSFLLSLVFLVAICPVSVSNAQTFDWAVVISEYRHYEPPFTSSDFYYMLSAAGVDTNAYPVYVKNIPNTSEDRLLAYISGWDDLNEDYTFAAGYGSPIPGVNWEDRTYTFYIDLNHNGQNDTGEPTTTWYIPQASISQMGLVQNVSIVGGYHPIITWDPAPNADVYRVRFCPVNEDGNPDTNVGLFQSDELSGSSTYSLTYTGDLFNEYDSLAVVIEAWEDYNDLMLNRSRYIVQHEPGANGNGYMVTLDLCIRAVINSEEKGPIEAVWKKGGEDTTSRGDQVIWGHFYANPSDVTWGNKNNPDLFVKIWFDVSGRVDVNYFHVSVPDIEVYSDYPYDSTADEHGTTTMSRRYIRQYYEGGQSYSDENYEDGNPPSGYSPVSNPSGYSTINDLRIGSMINTVEKGPIDAVWRLGGQDTTARGDQVVWGLFYASPTDVTWGSSNNPDLFVKIWFDVGGRVDVNFFHVSVPDIEVYSDLPSDVTYDQKGTTIMDNRYIRHEYWR
jgi:hypothetical protein